MPNSLLVLFCFCLLLISLIDALLYLSKTLYSHSASQTQSFNATETGLSSSSMDHLSRRRIYLISMLSLLISRVIFLRYKLPDFCYEMNIFKHSPRGCLKHKFVMTSIKFIHVDNNHNKVSVNSSSHIKKVSFRMESPNQLNR